MQEQIDALQKMKAKIEKDKQTNMAKNKIANEIKDIRDQITEGGHSIHEIDKICKRF